MKRFRYTRSIIFALTIIITGVVFDISILGFAVSNTVHTSHAGMQTQIILINNLRPPGCAGLELVSIIYCSGSAICNGTTQSELILGDSSNNLINGGSKKANPDCIIAGGGDDTVEGGNKDDICIEGPGNDSYKKCTVVLP